MTCNCNDPIEVAPITARVPIHPYVVNPCATGNCQFTIPPMTCYVFPFRLCPDAVVQTLITHTGAVQDRSLRAWFSREPLGQSVSLLPYNVSFWEPNRTGRQIMTVYDSVLPLPDYATSSIATEPGVYMLNVLNLINSSNQFSVTLTQCG